MFHVQSLISRRGDILGRHAGPSAFFAASPRTLPIAINSSALSWSNWLTERQIVYQFVPRITAMKLRVCSIQN